MGPARLLEQVFEVMRVVSGGWGVHGVDQGPLERLEVGKEIDRIRGAGE